MVVRFCRGKRSGLFACPARFKTCEVSDAKGVADGPNSQNLKVCGVGFVGMRSWDVGSRFVSELPTTQELAGDW